MRMGISTRRALSDIFRAALLGRSQALRDDAHLMNGLNVHCGQVTYEAVARDLDLPFEAAESVIG